MNNEVDSIAPTERVDLIVVARMFFLILLSCHSFHIIPLCFNFEPSLKMR